MKFVFAFVIMNLLAASAALAQVKSVVGPKDSAASEAKKDGDNVDVDGEGRLQKPVNQVQRVLNLLNAKNADDEHFAAENLQGQQVGEVTPHHRSANSLFTEHQGAYTTQDAQDNTVPGDASSAGTR